MPFVGTCWSVSAGMLETVAPGRRASRVARRTGYRSAELTQRLIVIMPAAVGRTFGLDVELGRRMRFAHGVRDGDANQRRLRGRHHTGEDGADPPFEHRNHDWPLTRS